MTTSNANYDANHYAALDYPVELSRRDEEEKSYWVCEVPDLPGCVADGETPDEAIESLSEAKRLWIEARLEHGHHVPEPTNTRGYSGRLLLRMPDRRTAATAAERDGHSNSRTKGGKVELGAFSISLAVEDLGASRAFYEKFGFEIVGGDPSQGWQILRNGNHTIGLFCGMFDKNILTFNPGWDAQGNPVESFTDVREIQRQVRASGLSLSSEADEATEGPASFIAIDPDGNPILVDQHV